MTDENYKDMVIQHDKHIDSLATSIESLAKGVSSTNRKLDDMIDVISKQNILFEKFTNLEENLKESFGRVHKRIEIIEATQNSKDGCQAITLIKKDVDSILTMRNLVLKVVGTALILAIIGTVLIR